MAAIYSLYIINKSGGLIFYRDYGPAGRMNTNDSLRFVALNARYFSAIVACFGLFRHRTPPSSHFSSSLLPITYWLSFLIGLLVAFCFL